MLALPNNFSNVGKMDTINLFSMVNTKTNFFRQISINAKNFLDMMNFLSFMYWNVCQIQQEKNV